LEIPWSLKVGSWSFRGAPRAAAPGIRLALRRRPSRNSRKMKQRTLAREVSIKGSALHTGDAVTLTMKPAPADHGIVFKRIDLHGHPELRPRVDQVTDLVRATTIQVGHAKIHTVEHVLSALHGCGIDNVLIEMDASEPPIMDGSARPFVNLILQGEPVEQEKERVYFELDAPVSVARGNSSIIALPANELKISCTSADDRGIHTQHLSLTIDPEVYQSQIAAARTFTIYEDIEELLKLGKIRGGSLDCAVVIRGDKIISKEPLRFKDEFVRHKILDIIGDVLLLGLPLKAHIVATRPGHAINADLTKALFTRLQERQQQNGGNGAAPKKKPEKLAGPQVVVQTETSMDIRGVLEKLPHRYPFVMIDRVIEIKSDDELVALKNVTINEPFFQGHYPGNPVMPGVLQVEAMAQAAGLLMLRKISAEGKTALFMSCDKVKFRRAVRPGDQLVINVKMTKSRGNKIGVAEGECVVNGQVVSSAELMFAVVDSAEVT
jgi:UDP-3-O-[3-hydroxymyristoyl] N-acetylglucosamine deacetylase/3-hydroxyacyl-[acyl-carrier-protein] dehydratase